MSSMSIFFWIELVIVLAVIFIGARFNGVGLGIWGGVGLFLIAVLFGVKPTAPPVDVLLIILAVVTAAATMDAPEASIFWCRWQKELFVRIRSTLRFLPRW